MPHDTIIKWLKIMLFTAFAVHLGRILIRTWKYGGSKSSVTVQYDDLNQDPENLTNGVL